MVFSGVLNSLTADLRSSQTSKYTLQVLSLLNAKQKKNVKKILFLGVNGASNSSTPCALQTDGLLVKLRPQASVGETRFRKVVKDG